jgi:hypothetical protein
MRPKYPGNSTVVNFFTPDDTIVFSEASVEMQKPSPVSKLPRKIQKIMSKI